MTVFIDQMNCTIRLESSPSRIVSLVPSQTQLLHYIGLEDEVVGITKFCIQPDEWFRSKDRVGGTKSVDIEKVRLMKPDLIIGNKEENSKEDIEQLREIAPVWMSDIETLDSALEMIRMVGELVGKSTSELRSRIQGNFEELASYVKMNSIISNCVLYFIWMNPDMIAGKKTFVDDMLTRCGLLNATTELRYPHVSPTNRADLIFLSSEPFPFGDKHTARFSSEFPEAKIVLVDGEMFSWYGSKLADAPEYFQNLLKSISKQS